jgi:hypothetical protein
MELGHSDIIRLLIDGGANVSLAHLVSSMRDYTCPLVPRSTNLKVADGLDVTASAQQLGLVVSSVWLYLFELNNL